MRDFLPRHLSRPTPRTPRRPRVARASPTEIVREQKRLVQKSVRDLEREKTAMERTEAALIADIKKAAKAGQVRVRWPP